jgi:D-glycero-D-manno-heptose 1,7-bisphosphate phosphatase
MPQPGIYLPSKTVPAEGTVPRRALFLDRDGVINVNHGYVCSPERTEWVPGIFELCTLARDAGYVLVVATNQAGIARGYYTEAEFLEYTRWMHGQFSERGLDILATVYCPHHPEAGHGIYKVDCACRKPAPGMFELAVRTFSLLPAQSVMVGDKASDLMAASAAGVTKGFIIEPDSLAPFGSVVSHLKLVGEQRVR